MAVVGLVEVVKHLPFFVRTLRKVKELLRFERPDLVILIDFPDFNFLVGQAAHRLGIPVFYYISPQIWAWRVGRVRKIREFVAKMFVLFPFEVEFYRSHGIAAEFTGHPFVEEVRSRLDVPAFRARYDLPEETVAVTLMPGSRRSELDRLLEPLLRTAELLARDHPDVRFLLPVPPNLREELPRIQAAATAATAPITVVDGDATNALAVSRVALVKSGTSTLEAALVGTPAAMFYRVAPTSYVLGRLLIRVEHVAIVNLLAGERLIPELLQEDVTPEHLSTTLGEMLTDDSEQQRIKRGYQALVESLSGEQAARRTVNAMLQAYRRWCRTAPPLTPALS